MDKMNIESLAATYRDGLLNDVVPFWLRHAVDNEHGGYMTCVDRDGTVIDTDKQLWQQGRFAWLLASMYARIEEREEWLAAAKSGLDFIDAHGFDDDGRTLFLVTREGRPLRKRRYVFSEAFAAMAFAAYGCAAKDDGAATRGAELFEQYIRYTTTPGIIEPKVRTDTRPMMGLGPHMIAINVSQTLRDMIGYEKADDIIDDAISEIFTNFVNEEHQVLLETCGPDGAFLDHFDGRMVNPGHSMEAAWFILDEARHRNDDALRELGLKILDWTWRIGWDEEFGGIYYFRDAKGLPVQEYWHDMKFWWPHCETIIATLLAYHLTGDDKYAQWHKRVHDWTYAHFPDSEYGEWFGYLHRDGRLSNTLKGSHWKGPFHIPRMQWCCWRLCDEMKTAGDG